MLNDEEPAKQSKRSACGYGNPTNGHRRIRLICTRTTGQRQQPQERGPLKFEEPSKHGYDQSRVKTIRSLGTVSAGHAVVQNLRRGYYEQTVDLQFMIASKRRGSSPSTSSSST
jgi:hypothetical protein